MSNTCLLLVLSVSDSESSESSQEEEEEEEEEEEDAELELSELRPQEVLRSTRSAILATSGRTFCNVTHKHNKRNPHKDPPPFLTQQSHEISTLLRGAAV
jgi:hypothetical protein